MSRPVFEKTGRPAPKFPVDFLCSTPSTSLYGGISNGNITMKSVAKKDDAVSPVIGTILLVAITVVLVAIVAAVVMGMVGGVGDSKTVGVTVTPYANATGAEVGYILTLVSGKDASSLKNVTSYLNPSDGTTLINQDSSSGTISATIGTPNYIKMTNAGGKNGQLTITGTFSDGTQAVIYQGSITIPNKTT